MEIKITLSLFLK